MRASRMFETIDVPGLATDFTISQSDADDVGEDCTEGDFLKASLQNRDDRQTLLSGRNARTIVVRVNNHARAINYEVLNARGVYVTEDVFVH